MALRITPIRLISAVTLAIVVLIFIAPHARRLKLHWPLSLYDLGFYGAYPTQTYVSFELESPWIHISRAQGQTCDQRYTFLSPRGQSVLDPGPVILNARGDLVWMSADYGEVTNFDVQRFRGQDYLTFWAGETHLGIGNGAYYMLNASYDTVYKLTPAGNYQYGDLHEFKLTDAGTALITIYEVVPKSLASIGGEREDRLFDNIIQEIDIATGELIFEWRASRHVDFEYSYLSVNYRHPDGASDAAYDAFHLNSVDKTPEGNYLISLRHMCAVYLVDGTTGAVLWTLGGQRNQFTDLRSPLGSATSFHFQHHARIHVGGDVVLTLFDNNGYDYNHITAPYARGMRLHLDTTTTRLTANLSQTYIDPQRTSSYSQGSLQYDLDRDKAITSHGHAASWTEFHAGTGAVVCDVHFGASILFDFSLVNSYRVFKRGWVGRPHTRPEVRPSGGRVWVSWNGATEVRGWGLQGAGAGAAATTTTTTRRTPKATPGAGGGVVEGDEEALDDTQWKTLEIIVKTGFEDSFTIPPAFPPATAAHKDGAYLRVVALDSEGAVLGTSRALSRREVEDGGSGAPGFLGVLAWAAGGTVVAVCCVRGWRGISGGYGGRGRGMRGRWWR